MASAFLFLFGTGPVRGFAVTLVIGLIANVFTAVFVSRAIFDFQMWRQPRLAHLSIGERTELFKATNIDFLSRRTLTLGLSVLAIVVSIGSLAVKGGPKYGLDFRGGTLMYVNFEPKPPIDDLRTALSAKLQSEISIQETQGTGEFIIGTELADEQTLDQARQMVETTLREKYANLGGKLDLNNAKPGALEDRLRAGRRALGEDEARKVCDRRAELPRSGEERDHREPGRTVQGPRSRSDGVERPQAGSRVGHFNIRSSEIVGPRAGRAAAPAGGARHALRLGRNAGLHRLPLPVDFGRGGGDRDHSRRRDHARACSP